MITDQWASPDHIVLFWLSTDPGFGDLFNISLEQASWLPVQTSYTWRWGWFIQGVPKKTHFHNDVGATVHWLNYEKPAPLVSGNKFFGRFLLRLSMIKSFQVMFMVKFSPTPLNFGYDFVLSVHFLGYPVVVITIYGVSNPVHHPNQYFAQNPIEPISSSTLTF